MAVKQITPILLDTVKEQKNDIPTFRLGDTNSRQFKILIMNGGIVCNLTGVTAMVYTKKPDGNVSYILGEVEDAVQGTIVAKLTSQMMNVVGSCEVKVRLINQDGSDLATPSFWYKVEQDYTNSEDIIISTNEYRVFVEALSQVNKTKYWKAEDEIVVNAGATQLTLPSTWIAGDMLDVIYVEYQNFMVENLNYTIVGNKLIFGPSNEKSTFLIRNFGS
ncbi:phage baseplate upper protein [Clostridium gasigenes]|uniref:BppU family phage baseplate upper protein n=1 Tax=Clostridium gasigenes TaxID=94869 RepID=UPI001C0C20C5|nr:BppU family phage baseplate upper protein [Clostridium gasigenes]MBU3135047.1 phage baseplate upper protein [Clostridium gasigenes]